MASTARIDELKKKFDENPRRYFAPLANEFRKAGEIEQAIMICEEFLPQQPGHMSGHIVYGQALYEAGRMPESRTVFETALGLDPENLIALRHLGDIARGQGEPESARSWYMRVLDADPRNEEIQAIIASLGASTVDVVTEDEDLSFGPKDQTVPDAAEIPVNPLGLEREEAPLEAPAEPPAAETVVMETVVMEMAPEEPPAAPQGDVDLLDGFSLTGMEGGGSASHEDTAHAPAEGFETTSFMPPEEPVATVADLDDSLDSGVPSFEAPAAPVEAVEGFQGAAPVDIDDLREDAAPSMEAGIDDLTLDDELVLPPQGDPLATPLSNLAVPAPARQFTSTTPTAPMPAYPRPADWPEPAEFEMPAGEAAATVEDHAEAAPAALEEAAPSAAEQPIPAELPPAVISAEAELLEEGGMLPLDAELEEQAPSGRPPFVTETMAELYMAQGFPEQARAVYVQLLENNPSDERLQGLVASLDAQQVQEESGPTVREFFARMAARRPATHAASAMPSDEDFASPAQATEEPDVPEDVPELAMAPELEPMPDLEPEPELAQEPEPATARSLTPSQAADYVPEVIAPAIERAAAMRTPGGSIDALFGNRAPGTSEDSAAAALAQAFGATAEEQPHIVGRPAHAASGELSLDSVFRDGGARPPRTSQSFSFDQFFAGGDARSVSGPRNSGEIGGASEVPAERSADDIEQFNSWLQGLKPR